MSFDQNSNKANITLMGVGGAGSNIVNRLYLEGASDIDFVVANTDTQALEACKVPQRIQLGPTVTNGQGCGAKPWIGEKAARESLEDIGQAIKNTNILFIVSGMGGGTGTGASPLIASLAKELDIMVISIVTSPFNFEGKKRKDYANIGIKHLESCSDSLIVLKNNEILNLSNKETTVSDALNVVDKFLKEAIRGLTNLMFEYGIINVDFEDVKTVIKDKGRAFLSVGTGVGENKIDDAIELALNNPLLETKINGAKSVLLNVSGGEDLSVADVRKVSEKVTKDIDPDANVIFGTTIEKDLSDTAIVTILATGFSKPIGKIMNYTAVIDDRPYEPAGPLADPVEIKQTEDLIPALQEGLLNNGHKRNNVLKPNNVECFKNCVVKESEIEADEAIDSEDITDVEPENVLSDEIELDVNNFDGLTINTENVTLDNVNIVPDSVESESFTSENKVNDDASIAIAPGEDNENISVAENIELENDVESNANIEDVYMDETKNDDEDIRIQEYFNLEDVQDEQRTSRINRHEDDGIDENKQGFFKMFSPK